METLAGDLARKASHSSLRKPVLAPFFLTRRFCQAFEILWDCGRSCGRVTPLPTSTPGNKDYGTEVTDREAFRELFRMMCICGQLWYCTITPARRQRIETVRVLVLYEYLVFVLVNTPPTTMCSLSGMEYEYSTRLQLSSFSSFMQSAPFTQPIKHNRDVLFQFVCILWELH